MCGRVQCTSAHACTRAVETGHPGLQPSSKLDSNLLVILIYFPGKFDEYGAHTFHIVKIQILSASNFLDCWRIQLDVGDVISEQADSRHDAAGI